MDNEKQFVEFLIEAKRNTYAGEGALSASSRPLSKDLAYGKGDYAYLDTYLGDVDFIGEEAVWFQGKPVWGMNYYGYMLTEKLPDEFSHCLKGALLQAPAAAPFRGPARFELGSLVYTCGWSGSLDRFQGIERISRDGAEIYRLFFHGGKLINS